MNIIADKAFGVAFLFGKVPHFFRLQVHVKKSVVLRSNPKVFVFAFRRRKHVAAVVENLKFLVFRIVDGQAFFVSADNDFTVGGAHKGVDDIAGNFAGTLVYVNNKTGYTFGRSEKR